MIAPAYLIIANLQIMSSTIEPKLAHCSLSVRLADKSLPQPPRNAQPACSSDSRK